MKKIKNLGSMKNSINISKKSTPFRNSIAFSRLDKIDSNPNDNYKFFYQIGFGAFGNVWKVCDKTNKK